MAAEIGVKLSVFGAKAEFSARSVSAQNSVSLNAQVAREFEATFLAQSIDEMLKTADASAFGGGHAEEMWRSFLAKAVADVIAQTASTGVAGQVEDAMAAYETGAER